MAWVWRVVALLAFLVAVLGLFWLAQGIGLIVVDPILCSGDCEPVDAPSAQWQIIGGATAVAGLLLGWFAMRRSRAGRRRSRMRRRRFG